MSLLTQKVNFNSGNRYLHLETDDKTIEAIENIAIILGATMTPDDPHSFTFDFNSKSKSNYAMDAIEKLWSNINFKEYQQHQEQKITICYENESLSLEGDSEKFNVFMALVKSIFKKDIKKSNRITFSKDEKSSFYALYNAAEMLGILPA